MPIRKKREKPVVGTVCTHIRKGKTYKMKIVETEDGLGYKVGTDVFKSPSAAAKSITKQEVNGWVFWHLDTK